MEKKTVKTSDAYQALLDSFCAEAQAKNVTAETLYTLGSAVARSVLKTAMDPERFASEKKYDSAFETAEKTGMNAMAPGLEVSNGGLENSVVRAYRSIHHDMVNVAGMIDAFEKAFKTSCNKEGDSFSMCIDSEERERVNALQSDTIGDGLDVVHDAVVALLEQAEGCNTQCENWIQSSIDVVKPSKRVLTSLAHGIPTETVESTPIQQVYRSVSKAVRSQKSVKANPTDMQNYICADELIPDAEHADSVYLRFNRQTVDLYGRDDSMNVAGIEAMKRLESKVASLELNKRQFRVIDYLAHGMSGFIPTGRIIQALNGETVGTFDSVNAIAKEYDIDVDTVKSAIGTKKTVSGFTYSWETEKGYTDTPTNFQMAVKLKTAERTIERDVAVIRNAFHDAGLSPKGWEPDMVKQNTAKAVMQMDRKTNAVIMVYPSLSEAAKAMEVNKSSICKALKTSDTNSPKACKGYLWKYVEKA